MNFTSGLPNGYWYIVRKYFVRGARYNITLGNGGTHQLIVPNSARVLTYIRSILSTWYGEQSLTINTYVSGNNRVYDFRSNNATIEFTLVVER